MPLLEQIFNRQMKKIQKLIEFNKTYFNSELIFF